MSDNKKTIRGEKKAQKKAYLETLSPKERKKHLLKRAVLIIAAVLLILFVIYLAGKLVLEKVLVSEPISQVDETYQSFNFYEVAEKDLWPDIDIFSDSEYMSLSHNPSFTSEELGGTFLLSDIPSSIRNEAHRFFITYFDVLQSGNYKLYPTLFSDRYKERMTGFEKDINREFPPQMVYNIEIKEEARVPDMVVDNKSCVIGLYRVSYLIHKNDGLFRSDIGRDIDLGKDIARPLYFELITFGAGTADEKTYINNLYTESSVLASGNTAE